MRKRLVAGLGLVSLLVAGCGDGGALSSPKESSPPSSAPAPTSEVKSQRSAPAKAVSIPDKCAIIAEPQHQELGVDQQPMPGESSGMKGCKYRSGELGSTGWTAFVAASSQRTYQEEIERRAEPDRSSDVAGYPFSSYEKPVGCLLFADVSDDGVLVVNLLQNGPDDPGVDLCDQAEKAAEAAVKNLPDA